MNLFDRQHRYILTFLIGIVLCGCHSTNDTSYEKIEKLLIAADKNHSEAVLVYKDNDLLVEEYFGTGASDKKIEIMSCTKSIVGLAIASLLSDGVIPNLDIPISKFYPEFNTPDKSKITVRHLCNMTSGLKDNQTTEEIYKSGNFIKFALHANLAEPPGQTWRYNNNAVNILAGVIQKLTNKRLDLYVSDRLFKPLGISDYTWAMDDAGNPQIMAGCSLRPGDFLKLGIIVLNKGTYDGRQVISSSAIDTILKPTEVFRCYGALWWINYEQTISIVDDSLINQMQQQSLPDTFITKIKLLKGVYSNNQDYYSKVESVFGKDPWHAISNILTPKNLRLSRKEYKGNKTYMANGFLGNYLIISPSKKIVAIRMTSHESHKSSTDDFPDFEKLALDIGQ